MRNLANEDLRGYLLHLLEEEKMAASSVSQVFNALRFLYMEILKVPLSLRDTPRAMKDKKLPSVLSQEEVGRILASLHNPKHRLLLALAYSAGLRVSEVIKLAIADLDPEGKKRQVRRSLTKGRAPAQELCCDVSANSMVFRGAEGGTSLLHQKR